MSRSAELMALARQVDQLCPPAKVCEIMDLPAHMYSDFETDMSDALDMEMSADPVFTVEDVLQAMGNWLRMLRTNHELVREQDRVTIREIPKEGR